MSCIYNYIFASFNRNKNDIFQPAKQIHDQKKIYFGAFVCLCVKECDDDLRFTLWIRLNISKANNCLNKWTCRSIVNDWISVYLLDLTNITWTEADVFFLLLLNNPTIWLNESYNRNTCGRLRLLTSAWLNILLFDFIRSNNTNSSMNGMIKVLIVTALDSCWKFS